MTSTPDDPTPDPDADQKAGGDSAPGVELGLGGGSTFEPEEDPEAAD